VTRSAPSPSRTFRGARRFARYLRGRRPHGGGALEPGEESYLRRAGELALEAERAGNVPIGAVIVLDGRVVGEGRNSVYRPLRHPGRHAETEALRAVPDDLWPRAREMTCYSTLEPCIMCLASLYFHGVQRVVFGASAPAGGAGPLIPELPWYMRGIQWIGPLGDASSRELRRRVRRSLQRTG
jgi:tRNA(adenine34) deaminase